MLSKEQILCEKVFQINNDRYSLDPSFSDVPILEKVSQATLLHLMLRYVEHFEAKTKNTVQIQKPQHHLNL